MLSQAKVRAIAEGEMTVGAALHPEFERILEHLFVAIADG